MPRHMQDFGYVASASNRACIEVKGGHFLCRNLAYGLSIEKGGRLTAEGVRFEVEQVKTKYDGAGALIAVRSGKLTATKCVIQGPGDGAGGNAVMAIGPKQPDGSSLHVRLVRGRVWKQVPQCQGLCLNFTCPASHHTCSLPALMDMPFQGWWFMA